MQLAGVKLGAWLPLLAGALVALACAAPVPAGGVARHEAAAPQWQPVQPRSSTLDGSEPASGISSSSSSIADSVGDGTSGESSSASAAPSGPPPPTLVTRTVPRPKRRPGLLERAAFGGWQTEFLGDCEPRLPSGACMHGQPMHDQSGDPRPRAGAQAGGPPRGEGPLPGSEGGELAR